MNIEKIRQSLSDLLAEIHRYVDADQDSEIKNWLMAATLRIWAGNKLCAEEYTKVLPVFHGQQYTIAQVLTALNCVGEDSREMGIPAFFQTIIQQDIRNLTSHSRDIADEICRFLAESVGIHHTAFHAKYISEIPRNPAGKILYSELS